MLARNHVYEPTFVIYQGRPEEYHYLTTPMASEQKLGFLANENVKLCFLSSKGYNTNCTNIYQRVW